MFLPFITNEAGRRQQRICTPMQYDRRKNTMKIKKWIVWPILSEKLENDEILIILQDKEDFL